MGTNFFQSLNTVDLAAARRIAAKQLLEAATTASWHWWAVVDGDVIPGSPFDMYQHGDFIDTPIL
jgi:hypothetical protein